MSMGIRGLALTMVLLIVTVSIGAKVTGQTYQTLRNDSSACTDGNASTTCVENSEGTIAYEGTSSLGDFSDWFSIIVIAGVGGAILSLLMKSFSGANTERGM